MRNGNEMEDDMEDEVTLEALAVQPEAAVQPKVVIQPEVATPIATVMERPRRQQRQPVHLQDCEVNLDDEVDDNGNLVRFAFLAESEPVRLADAIQHPKWKKDMNEELMAIEEKQYHNSNWEGCSKSELKEDVGYSDFIIINSDFITLKLFYRYIALMASLQAC